MVKCAPGRRLKNPPRTKLASSNFVIALNHEGRFSPGAMKLFFSAHFLIGGLAALFSASSGGLYAGPASEFSPDKSGYHLFNPTPRAFMREMSTDRPDQTESPYTVDAGHVQVEMDFVNFTSDRHSPDGVRTETWNVAPVNLKIGLHNRVDLQVIFDNYLDVRTRESGVTGRASGFGDITARLKINLWGNDGGPTALAIMPFVKLPLDASNLRNGRTEGGIIVPLAVALPGGWGMGLMTEVDFVSDGDDGHDIEWLNSITFSRDLTTQLAFYVELVAVVGTAPGFDWQAQADTGLTFAVSDNVQLDCGCNFGLTRPAPDFQPFAGLTVRF